MKRIPVTPRHQWQKSVEQLGFGFHTTNVPYWDETAYYDFDRQEIELLENATAELWQMSLTAVQHVIDRKLYSLFHIPPAFISYLEKSWQENYPSVYGRFDLCYHDGQVKMLEFNADTPTSLYEAGIIQWFWLQDFDKTKDQFNSIHEKLIAQWGTLKDKLHPGPLHFACLKGTLEDLTNTEYLRDCAIQAGIQTKFLFIEDIGWDIKQNRFVDDDYRPVENLFKLYPWEWLLSDEIGAHIVGDDPLFIEPAWKMILSNKAILPVLWELFPGHSYLLPGYFNADLLSDYVKKPILSREGANIEMMVGKECIESTGGEYGEEGFVYQQLCKLPDFDGHYPLIGSWVIGNEPAGIGIRESNTLITHNTSRFVPHLITYSPTALVPL